MELRVQKHKKHDTSQNKWNNTYNGIPSLNAIAGLKNLVLKVGAKDKPSTLKNKGKEPNSKPFMMTSRRQFSRISFNFRRIISFIAR